MIWEYAANVVAGYLVGSIPFGLVIGYAWLRRDIRELGSGKTGATNVLRTAGKFPAALVMVSDVGKAVVPAIVGRFVFEDDGVAAAGAGAAIVGHVWPVFAGFRGGRGVATAFGGILGLSPLVALVFPVIAFCVVAPTRYVSLMSILATPLSAAVVIAGAAAGWIPAPFALYALFVTAIIEYMHIPNLRRLMTGTEPKIGRGGDRTATG
jgi:glycerol-3-phosphate acyltransferase PlsY